MLHINFLKEHKEEVIKRLAVKYFDATDIIEEIIRLDDDRKVADVPRAGAHHHGGSLQYHLHAGDGGHG